MKILYVYDALCGWCYGFSPVIQKFAENYQKELSFDVVSGGMVTGNRIGPIGEVAGYISQAYRQVEQVAGITFGKAFLEGVLQEGSAVFTSVPPSIALSICKKEKPGKAISFSSALQKAIYYDGMKPDDLQAYGKLAAEFGFEEQKFVEMMQDDAFKALAEADFQASQQLGVTGFPTVFLVREDGYLPLARGYMSYETLEGQYLKVKDID